MQLIKRTIQGCKEFTFACEYQKTRNGFKHVCKLFALDIQYPEEEATCYYYNRTWECWTYQSVCRAVVYKIIEREKKRAVDCYKRLNNCKRISAEKRKEIEESCLEVNHTWQPLLDSLK